MKLLYFNDLRRLPNFGCRTTGAALEEMLSIRNEVNRRDGLETVVNSGWDKFATSPIHLGGFLPHRIYSSVWKRRYRYRKIFDSYQTLDRFFGARHDFISENPLDSVETFLHHAGSDSYYSHLLAEVRACDAMVINGEGTLIFGNPTKRDALFILFVMALGWKMEKKVHLLNAMITVCPFSGVDKKILEMARFVLAECETIVCREAVSEAFVKTLIGPQKVKMIPDALFYWGKRFRDAADAIKIEPGICVPFDQELEYRDLDFSRPYICVSGSSSAWRFGERAVRQMTALVEEIRHIGLPVYLVQTCTGDSYLSRVGKKAGVPVVPFLVPVLAGGGILAGAEAYLTGRYHPAIMAAAGGVPTIFLSSNSHKTKSVQSLLGYEEPLEFPICPEPKDIGEIRMAVERYLGSRARLAERIRTAFERQAELASEYIHLIS